MFKDKIEFRYFLIVVLLTSSLTWLFSPKDHQVEFKQINKRFNEIKEELKQLKHDITTPSLPVDYSRTTDELMKHITAISKRLSSLETGSHRDKFKLINKRINEIEEQMKYDITTPSQPVDISIYTDQLLSIKETIATHSERLSLLETQSHPVEHHPVELKGTVYTRTELDNLLDEIKNSFKIQLQEVRNQCNRDIQNQYNRDIQNQYNRDIQNQYTGYDKIQSYERKTSRTNEKVEKLEERIFYVIISFSVLLILTCCCICVKPDN